MSVFHEDFLKLQGGKSRVVPSSRPGDFTKGKLQQHWRRHLSNSVPTSHFMRYLASACDLYKLAKLASAPL